MRLNIDSESLCSKIIMLKDFHNFNIDFKVGTYHIKTLRLESEIYHAFKLRYQVFNLEITGNLREDLVDSDEFDKSSDHLGIYDLRSGQLIATCRLTCSLFSDQFYTRSEFQCEQLINNNSTKLEIGRVCVDQEHRKSIIILLLWRAIANYMSITKSKILFGCGSVMTEKPSEALIILKYLIEENKISKNFHALPQEAYRSSDLDDLIKESSDSPPLSLTERSMAIKLLPSLCKSYFDIGCRAAGIPAFDREFKCIDFLTILEVEELNPRLKSKLFGGQ